MKNKFNNLLQYIYEYSEKPLRKETINGLFRTILSPLSQYQNTQACVFLRIFDTNDIENSIKRLTFSGVKLFNFSDTPVLQKFINCELENIWKSTQFLLVLSSRYSAVLLFDYSTSKINDCSEACLLFNSKIIADIAKLIAENSTEHLTDLIKKYSPDRRENTLLNKSIQSISYLLNDKNEDYISTVRENTSYYNFEDSIKTAEIVNKQAKFVSHEIKNYISIINIYSQIIEKKLQNVKLDYNTQQSVKNALKNVNLASENISFLINDLRCMSNVHKTEADLSEVIENSIELCKQKISNNHVKLHTSKMNKKLIFIDKVKVECAIINIINNAISANAKNITVELSENAIIIKNDGDEINEKIREKIFEENFTTKKDGNGLGLAFCKQELNRAGGDINLLSSDIYQTVFEITVC